MNITVTIPDDLVVHVPDAETICAEAIANAVERRVVAAAQEESNQARKAALAGVRELVAGLRNG
jgi:hypothetical protein